MSGQINTYGRKTTLCHIAEKILQPEESSVPPPVSASKRSILHPDEIHILCDTYNSEFNKSYQTFDIDPVVKNIKTYHRFDEQLRRQIYFSTTDHQSATSRSHDYNVSVVYQGNRRFGQLKNIFEHQHEDRTFLWVKLELFPLPEKHGPFWVTDDSVIETRIFPFHSICNPVITAPEDNKICFLKF